MRIALAQMLSTTDPQENLRTLTDLTARAAGRGADVVVFPEAAMCAFSGPVADAAEPLDGPWARQVASLAAAHGVTIVAGTFTPAPDGRTRNTLLVTDGATTDGYDKIHLYDAFGYRESDTVQAGTDLLLRDIGGVRFGFATCYDVRFPEQFVALAEAGAQVVVVSASWGDGPGKAEAWRLLTTARALDTTCFVAACGQADPASVGNPSGPGPLGVGHSRLVAPDGALVGALDQEPGLLVEDLDLAALEQARQALPVMANRVRLTTPAASA
ncbi:carbon-nitrogen hydrolase family protein [Streptomyces sp. NPDC004783]|uniref:carbon-nitrogen hydrolase family protein n=1 Tax=unclassified Streptomyces TaxID=2593676 RepID=UPI0033A4F6AA